MKKYGLGKINLILLTALVALVMVPSVSFAAGDVFDTIQAKMISTVKDLRKIAYVIAGFGLVMFSFLAIFNKISLTNPDDIFLSEVMTALSSTFQYWHDGRIITLPEPFYHCRLPGEYTADVLKGFLQSFHIRQNPYYSTPPAKVWRLHQS